MMQVLNVFISQKSKLVTRAGKYVIQLSMMVIIVKSFAGTLIYPTRIVT